MSSPRILVATLGNSPGLNAAAGRLAAGAATVGSQVRVSRSDPDAALAGLDWADGVAFGVNGHGGTLAPEAQRFLESTAALWKGRRLAGLVVSAFSADSSLGSSTARMAVYRTAYHWGSLVVGDTASNLNGPDTTHLVGIRLARLAARLAEARAVRLQPPTSASIRDMHRQSAPNAFERKEVKP